MMNLFRSELTYVILRLFINHPDTKMFLAEISKHTQKNPANITRELRKLINENLICTEKKLGKKFYFLNPENSVIQPMAKLIQEIEKEALQNDFQGKWILGEDIPNICPFFGQIWMNCFVDKFSRPGGKAYKKVIAVYKGYHLWFYFDEKDACSVGKHLVDRFQKDPEFMRKVNKKIIYFSDMLRAYSEKLPDMRLEKISNKKLFKYHLDHEHIHTEYYQWGWIPVAADMFCNNLTDRGKEILRKKGVATTRIEEYLMLLTHPQQPSLIKQEQESLTDIAVTIQENKAEYDLMKKLFKKFKEQDVKIFGLYTHSEEYENKFEEVVRDLENALSSKTKRQIYSHYQKYFYTKHIFTEEQGVYSYEYYLKSLVRLVAGHPHLKTSHKKERQNEQKLLRKRKALIQKLILNKKEIEFFDQWGNFMITKIYRRYAQIYALYRMTPIVEEIGRRLGLTLKQTRFMTTQEINKGLFGEAINKDEIKRRARLSVFYTDKKKNVFYIGSHARKIRDMLQKEEIEQVSQIEGQCGCQGYAKGKVRIINDMKDMHKMEEGDILVSIATQPNLLPAMKKASAFVTDQGGVTSHAAIVAREMKTPCVIGTKIATRVMHDGDIVEVDANKGLVRIVKKSS